MRKEDLEKSSEWLEKQRDVDLEFRIVVHRLGRRNQRERERRRENFWQRL